jgi:prepilin-type N-terminal cleavage/methylation domain-containing protein
MKYKSGFTLVEMAIVLVIVGLLVSAFLAPLGAQRDLKDYSDTRATLALIQEALYGYALSHPALDGKPHLPCPDTDGDNAENRNGAGACSAPEGNLPSRDLGIVNSDSWNNNYRYRVTTAFADSSTGFTLVSNGGINIRSAVAGNVVAANIPVVIISWGKNGAIIPAVGSAEGENRNNNTDFVTQDFSTSFDDVIVWISPNVLFNRMVAAGQLP